MFSHMQKYKKASVLRVRLMHLSFQLHRAVLSMFIDVSEEHNASVFKAKVDI